MNKFFPSAIILLAGWLPILSHSQEVRSFHPVVTETNAVVQSEFEGKWVFTATDTVSVDKAGDNFYHLTLLKSSSKYEAMLGRLNGQTILQLLPMARESKGTSNDFIPVYTIYQATFISDTLQLSGLSYQSVLKHIQSDTAIRYNWLQSMLILNAATTQLQELLGLKGARTEFFNDEITLTRVARSPTISPRRIQQGSFQRANTGVSRQTCLPSFPLKKGWLGGDGNVSVAISATTTLWLFSDSFVGGEEQTSREGSSIIANSVGVMRCESGGHAALEYYWKKKYTPDPQPVFESGTSRYKFWVNDALLYDSVLYVVLEKIGSRSEPTAADETFNFQHVGWTLARVDNPYDLPDNWKIEYLPIQGIPDKKWTGQFALSNGYVHMFFREDSASILARYPIASIEAAHDSVQYYTNENTWKLGTGGDDAAVLFSGDDCQTVEYHPGIKKWLMIIGPGFWSNKIRMRQASELTGPWSDEIVLYECPEQTPGSPSYQKDNFCYLGREHIQFYDPKTRTMLLTYDHNTVNFQRLLKDTSIYVPKVIRVKMKN